LKVWTKQKPQLIPANPVKLEPVLEIDKSEEFKDRRRGKDKALFGENKMFNTRLFFAVRKLNKRIDKGMDLKDIRDSFLRRNQR